jgi:hypothetical protein
VFSIAKDLAEIAISYEKTKSTKIKN